MSDYELLVKIGQLEKDKVVLENCLKTILNSFYYPDLDISSRHSEGWNDCKKAIDKHIKKCGIK